MAIEYLFGRNSVRESLRAGRRQHRSVHIGHFVKPDDRIDEIRRLARALSIPVVDATADELDRHAPHGNQGVILETSSYPYADGLAYQNPGPGDILLALDELEDPRNVGALIRSAEAAGVSGIIFPERRSVDVTPSVVNASSGAVEHLSVWREKNLARWLAAAANHGYWLIGLDGGPDSQDLFDTEIPMPAVVVIGSEGRGLRRLTRERCDFLVRIPMYGQIESLNAAAAGSIALFHIKEFGG